MFDFSFQDHMEFNHSTLAGKVFFQTSATCLLRTPVLTTVTTTSTASTSSMCALAILSHLVMRFWVLVSLSCQAFWKSSLNSFSNAERTISVFLSPVAVVGTKKKFRTPRLCWKRQSNRRMVW